MSVRDVMSTARHNSTVMFEAHASASAVVMASGEEEISRVQQSVSWVAAQKRREMRARSGGVEVPADVREDEGDGQAGFGAHDHGAGRGHRSMVLWRKKTLWDAGMVVLLICQCTICASVRSPCTRYFFPRLFERIHYRPVE